MIVVLALLPLVATAETAYVTDNLRLGIHRTEDTSDRPFRMLESGQEFEILTRDRLYANVRLPDGTEGWVKSAYLVDEKPAKLIVAETMAERDALAAELAAARAAFAAPAETIQKLKDELAGITTELEAARARIVELEAAGADVEAVRQRYRGSVPLSWVGGVLAVSLILGFLIAMWWVDHRSRKRHGGIRVY